MFNKATWVQNSYWNALLGVVLFLKQHPWESSKHTWFQCVENTAGKTLLLWSLSDTKSTGADFLHQGFALAGLDSERMCGRFCFLFFFYESWASSLLINRGEWPWLGVVKRVVEQWCLQLKKGADEPVSFVQMQKLLHCSALRKLRDGKNTFTSR